MKLVIKNAIAAALVFALMLTSCKRQILEDPNLFLAYIPITMDWSHSYVDEDYTQNVSIYFFPKDGSTPYLLISGDINFAVATVPINDYSILIFNDVVDNLLGIRFDGTDRYNNFTLYSNPLDSSGTMFYQPESGEFMAAVHDRVGSWSLDSFSVTAEMVEYTRSADFTKYIDETRTIVRSRSSSDASLVASLAYPSVADVDDQESVTSSLDDVSSVVMNPSTVVNTITVEIENLNNASIIEGTLRGFASGVHLASNSRLLDSNTTNTYKFNFTKCNYESNQIDGSAYHQLATFGKIDSADATYELVLNIIISNGQLFTFTRDVTKQVNSSEESNIVINLDNSDTDADDGMIILPEGTGEGFGVTDWENKTDITLN